ncbi:hypothetical protein E2R60_04390 [Paenibacillus dendritiformis]|uniref:hypothetical protein n=1 Tax=Paenibacillus dendritiformis TaxID=130049 RepID=UPI00105A0813|nr:hypothetical protein [Paenibacillus dendritiformis]TDL57735.1 hypothetical protein E2R60_04390 [Paenibacillus dendritiformis]
MRTYRILKGVSERLRARADHHHSLAAAPLHPYRQILEEFMGSLPNPDNLRDMLAQVMRLLAEQGLADKELILTEWNSTAYQGIDE